ncbi:MAG TPA: DNA recombination protein RmuC [Terracidiphilus sp.]|nr:DNA recombination protein RmuC [Terracidiphilus sp.]
MQALIAGIAILAGIVVGFWIRSHSASAEKALLDQRNRELADALNAARAELTQAQAESLAHAGFESLAAEREKSLQQLAAERDTLRSELQASAEVVRTHTAHISQLEADLRNERQNLAEKLALLETAKQALANQFESLAAEILEKKSKTFSEGSQKELGTLLTPLREQIKEFREKVEQAQSDSKTGVTKLETLIGTLGGLNQQLTAEAHNLTTALRGSAKAQGDWGELIARNLLEKAGLREGEQFRVQETFDSAADGEGRQKKARPDVIVNLPGGRHLIIDSKVSLNAYTDSVNAETDDDREAAVKRHLASVRAHVDELAERRYHKLNALETPDFVIMFIPIEPAFLTALHEDESLWRYAYEKEVLLVGPTTLLFVIRIVDNLWQQELQARSVQDVMNRGAELYDKFVGFVGDLEAVGKSLRGADQSYISAMKKLSEGRGNLIRQVEMLKQLGIRTGKSLPRNLLDRAEVEEPTLALAAEAEDEADFSS